MLFRFWYKMVSILSRNFAALFLKQDLNFSTACIITFPWAWLQNRNRQINYAFVTEPRSFLEESFYNFVKQSSWQLFYSQGSGNGTLWTWWTVMRVWFRLMELNLYSRFTICQFPDYSKLLAFSAFINFFISVMGIIVFTGILYTSYKLMYMDVFCKSQCCAKDIY